MFFATLPVDRLWQEWVDINKQHQQPPSSTDDNTQLFEERFKQAYSRLHDLLDLQTPNPTPLLQDLIKRTYELQARNTENLRNRQKGYLARMEKYGLEKGNITELGHKVDDIVNTYLTNLQTSYEDKLLSLRQLEALNDLQTYAQKLGTAGTLANLLKITPVNPEALKQQALASGQLANLMTTPAYTQNPNNSLIAGLIGAGIGYFTGGVGGAGIGFSLGSLLGSLF